MSATITLDLAVARLAANFRLDPREARLLRALLAAGPEGVAPPLEFSARKLFHTYVCRLRFKTTGEPGFRITGVQIPGDPRTLKAYVFPGLAHALALAETLSHLDPREPPAELGPPIETLTKCEAAIHQALVAAGADFLGLSDLQAALVGAGFGRGALSSSIKVHLSRIRTKAAGRLTIECMHGVGWRYQPDRLADFLGLSVGAAQPSHLSPIKEGPAR